MFRIDSDDAVASLPTPNAVGSPAGYFQEGNPSIGKKATQISFDWLNALQETVIHPLEKKGLTLSKDAPYGLLTEALQNFLGEGGIINGLSLSVSSGLLSLIGSDGNILSGTNFGIVPCRSITSGKKIPLKIAEPISLQGKGGATSEILNVGLGITEARDWASVMPLFLYVVNRSDSSISDTEGSSAICISRNPAMYVTPASTYIGKKSTAPATDAKQSIILLGNNYTTANYASLPCHLIGVIGATWASADSSYTFSALSIIGGLGEGELNRAFANEWNHPAGQNGAASGDYFTTVSGTLPAWSTFSYTYKLNRLGEAAIKLLAYGDGGTDGSGSNLMKLYLPFSIIFPGTPPQVISTDATYKTIGSAFGQGASAWVAGIPVAGGFNDGNAFLNLLQLAPYSGGGAINQANLHPGIFTSGARCLYLDFSYRAF